MNSKIKKIALMFALIITIGFSALAIGCGRKNAFAGDTPENTYQINYVLGAVGAKNNALNPGLYVEGETTNLYPASFTSSDTFEGWYTDAAFTNKITQLDPSIVVQGNVINLYAKFKVFNISGTTLNEVTPWGKNVSVLDIPKEITSIKVGALEGTDATTINFDFNSKIEHLPAACFALNRNLTSVSLPSTIKEIFQPSKPYSGEINSTDGIFNPFYGCTNLTEVKFPLGSNNFQFYEGALYFSDGAKATLISGTNSCKFMPTGIMGVDVYYIGSDAFRGLDITSIEIGANITEVRERAFKDCKNLKTVTNGVGILKTLRIKEYAFADCSSMTSNVLLSTRVVAIETHAFDMCSALTDFTLSSNLGYIAPYAFIGVARFNTNGKRISGPKCSFEDSGSKWNIVVDGGVYEFNPTNPWGVLYPDKNMRALTLSNTDEEGYANGEWRKQ